jgi:predicted nucleic acid-binding protein
VKLFLDSTVIFSAIYSPTGGAGEIVRLGDQGKVKLCVSYYVLLETKRNLQKKAPERLPQFKQAVDTWAETSIFAVNRQEVLKAAAYTELKDAPVVAAAIKAKVDALVTLDKPHLLKPPQVAQKSGLNILTPGEALHLIRSQRVAA